MDLEDQSINLAQRKKSDKTATQLLSPLDSSANAVFLTDVQFGTPPQKFSLLADTGSSWTWVYTCSNNFKQLPFDRASAAMTASESACPSYYFNPKASSSLTCEKNRKHFIQYGIGSINGNICEDVLGVPDGDDVSAKMPFL